MDITWNTDQIESDARQRELLEQWKRWELLSQFDADWTLAFETR